MNILFIHQNFPGQFLWLSQAMSRRGHHIKALSISGKNLPCVEVIKYPIKRNNTPQLSPLLVDIETKVIRGEACAHAMINLKNNGFIPHLIIAHAGWGEAMFAKDIFPNSKLICFIEFFYQMNQDADFDPEFRKPPLQLMMSLRTKNINNLMALNAMDAGLCPTEFQFNTVPEIYRNKINVIFDGIDTLIVKPSPEASFSVSNHLNQKIELTSQDEVVSFVNRNLEPYRGYHSFMRSLPKILETRPNAKIIIVGGENVSYGAKPDTNQTWKEIFLTEVKNHIDINRVFFVGTIPHDKFINLLQITSVHVYLTYPFVLSWSMVEAMSAGAIVVASKTKPVEEFIQDGANGLLVDFFNYDEIANKICEVLLNPERFIDLGKKARQTIQDKYDLQTICLPKQITYLESFI